MAMWQYVKRYMNYRRLKAKSMSTAPMVVHISFALEHPADIRIIDIYYRQIVRNT